MASPHVPVARALRLPRTFAAVPGYLAQHDPDLRIRRSVSTPGCYILERRCRRRSAVHLGRPDLSDLHVQARDGYIHVATVHPSYLLRPWNIVRTLKEEGEDLFVKSAAKVSDEQQYAERWAKETRRRQVRDDFRARAREMYDHLDRRGDGRGNERIRINNAGMPSAPTRQQRRAAQRAAKKVQRAARVMNARSMRPH